MKFLSAVFSVCSVMLLTSGAVRAADVDASDPKRLIETAAQAMLDDLNAHRAEYRKDPKKIDALVDRILLPHFDTTFAAQRVLKANWRTATPEQRKRFIDAFYKFLLHNYGSALVDFTGDRLKVLPARAAANSDQALVQTKVKRNDGTMVAVDYRVRKTADGWKAWDVVIEGISSATSFGNDFNAQIQKEGLDAVIKRLERGDAPVKDPAPPKSK